MYLIYYLFKYYITIYTHTIKTNHQTSTIGKIQTHKHASEIILF